MYVHFSLHNNLIWLRNKLSLNATNSYKCQNNIIQLFTACNDVLSIYKTTNISSYINMLLLKNSLLIKLSIKIDTRLYDVVLLLLNI